jgi:myo-inositol catabolism protein IolC
MEASSLDDTAEALATVARRMLVLGEPVDLPTVGTLEVRHERSTIEERDDGETILHPPKDHVVFTPDE